MKLKNKKEILTEKLKTLTSIIEELIKEYKTGERDAEDFFHEMYKKTSILKDAVEELEAHENHLAKIKKEDEERIMAASKKEIKKFEAGKEYSTRSTCDHNCIFKFKIVRRTAKNVWIIGSQIKEITRRKIKIFEGEETILPLGSFSMAPILRAK